MGEQTTNVQCLLFIQLHQNTKKIIRRNRTQLTEKSSCYYYFKDSNVILKYY